MMHFNAKAKRLRSSLCDLSKGYPLSKRESQEFICVAVQIEWAGIFILIYLYRTGAVILLKYTCVKSTLIIYLKNALDLKGQYLTEMGRTKFPGSEIKYSTTQALKYI